METLEAAQEHLNPNMRSPLEEMYILLTQDGEYAPLEVVLTQVRKIAEFHKIELMKHSAGCSLIQQALDLSKGFWQWKKGCKVPPCAIIPESQWPPYASLVKAFLKKHKMDEASIHLYIHNYFLRIPTSFQNSFKIETMQSGWRRSGMYPYDSRTLLSHCPQLHHLNSSQVAGMLQRLKPLVESIKLTGEPTDQQMIEAVGDYLDLESIRLVDGLVLNQRRAVWLNKCNELQRREEKRRQKNQANASSSTTLINIEPEVGVTYCRNLNCGVKCKNDTEVWKGCSGHGCSVITCPKTNCVKQATNHSRICSFVQAVTSTSATTVSRPASASAVVSSSSSSSSLSSSSSSSSSSSTSAVPEWLRNSEVVNELDRRRSLNSAHIGSSNQRDDSPIERRRPASSPHAAATHPSSLTSPAKTARRQKPK